MEADRGARIEVWENQSLPSAFPSPAHPPLPLFSDWSLALAFDWDKLQPTRNYEWADHHWRLHISPDTDPAGWIYTSNIYDLGAKYFSSRSSSSSTKPIVAAEGNTRFNSGIRLLD